MGIDASLVEKRNAIDVEREVCRKVDEEMRVELEKLRASIDCEKPPKSKKKKGAAKKGAGKAGGGKGKKKEKDLTAESSTEELFKLMCEEGLITIPNDHWRSLDDLIVSKSNVGGFLEISNSKELIFPNFRNIVEYIKYKYLLPLTLIPGCQETLGDIVDVDERNEDKEFKTGLKSLLLAGPKGTGKHSVFKGLCKDTGAVVIDLSVNKLTASKFPGKDGLKMLMHLLSKLGRLLQPVIILINQADLMFRKKVPKYEDVIN